MNAQHLSMSQEWFTPQPIIEAAREVMGGIDLDPASSSEANKRVRAGVFFNKDIDGLEHEWHGRVFLNPPGGKRGLISIPFLFWEKLADRFCRNKVSEAVFVAFSLEQMQVTQSAFHSVLDYPFCVPSKRMKFTPGSGQKAKSPTHSNAIVYLGPNKDKFRSVFSQFGKVVIPQ